jgi:uncharacterized membrane protein YgcG
MPAPSLLGLGVALAAGPPALPPAGVVDGAGLLDPAAEAALAAAVAEVEGGRVAVVTAATARPETPEAAADALLAAWFPDGDGVVLLLAARERRLVARAGAGVAGLDDRFLAVMAQESMVPRLVGGDVGGALLAGVARIDERLSGGGPGSAVGAVALGLAVALAVVGRELRS